MRIKEEYKKSGYFWLPQHEDKKIAGTLSIFDGGKVELEVVDLFDESVATLNGDHDLGRIIGHVEKDGLVTLEDCWYRTKRKSFGGIAKSLVHVSEVISGVAYDKDELVTFNTVTFAVEGISEWVGITGISVSHSSDHKTASINYTAQEDIVYNLSDGFKLHIVFGYTLPGFSNTAEARVTHHTYFKLSSEAAQEFPEFRKIIHQITYLLCLAVDSTVTISDVSATSSEIVVEFSEGKRRAINMRLYYPSRPFSKEFPKIDIYRMLFRFPDIRENAEGVFNKWLSAYSVIKPSLGLYFSAASGDHKYLDGRFLALAQALETYHRRTSSETLMEDAEFRPIVAALLWRCPKKNRKWLKGRLSHGNEIHLGLRIKRIIEPYKTYLGNAKQRSKIIRGIVNTRNYLTHYNEALEKDSAKGSDLWNLCQKMEAIFQLHLLQQLGFERSDIERILSNSYRLKQKLDEIIIT